MKYYCLDDLVHDSLYTKYRFIIGGRYAGKQYFYEMVAKRILIKELISKLKEINSLKL